MKSKRIYITLNPNKKKDKIILDYVNSTYSEAETIKHILYQFASNRCNEVLKDTEIIEKDECKEVQKVANCIEEVIKDEYQNQSNLEVDNDILSMFQ